ncbi:methionine adenosyltransferase domain-containing protein [Christensenellaceae bacterium NSJ-44]|uniref:Methionine adenosyltransferase domain-containing protein n=1 Tax=Luoshenia tenuis TaxID=2763654 RepID=A0A926HMU6_9FIRM|nr:methionine adenosyltransferase domain-containing protein [Luoshenia tenuis]MBC8529909.1 methionine adenosyltransferase domain-containing protein [Luoshenia tenuis]
MATLQTARAYCRGQSDSLCGQIADRILDAALSQDPGARMRVDVALAGARAWIGGELSADAQIDYAALVRQTLLQAGYPDLAQRCQVELALRPFAPEAEAGLRRADAGDGDALCQGLYTGYACREGAARFPLAAALAQALCGRLDALRAEGDLPGLLPDGGAFVALRAGRIDALVLCAQHLPSLSTDLVRALLEQKVVAPCLPEGLESAGAQIFINPSGRFTQGGPAAFAGSSGHLESGYGDALGQPSLAGRDATRTCGAYMARYIAKNLVAAGLARRCRVKLCYALGLADPVALEVETFGEGGQAWLGRLVSDTLDLRPAAIIRRFGLRRPLYAKLAACGRFGPGAQGAPWEQEDLAAAWRQNLDGKRGHEE